MGDLSDHTTISPMLVSSHHLGSRSCASMAQQLQLWAGSVCEAVLDEEGKAGDRLELERMISTLRCWQQELDLRAGTLITSKSHFASFDTRLANIQLAGSLSNRHALHEVVAQATSLAVPQVLSGPLQTSSRSHALKSVPDRRSIGRFL